MTACSASVSNTDAAGLIGLDMINADRMIILLASNGQCTGSMTKSLPGLSNLKTLTMKEPFYFIVKIIPTNDNQ